MNPPTRANVQVFNGDVEGAAACGGARAADEVPAFPNKRHKDRAATMARYKAVTEAMYGRRRGVRPVRLT